MIAVQAQPVAAVYCRGRAPDQHRARQEDLEMALGREETLPLRKGLVFIHALCTV